MRSEPIKPATDDERELWIGMDQQYLIARIESDAARIKFLEEQIFEAGIAYSEREHADGEKLREREAQVAQMVTKMEKICAWIDRLASNAEQLAKNSDRFPAFADANRADARNYRRTASDIRSLLGQIGGRVSRRSPQDPR